MKNLGHNASAVYFKDCSVMHATNDGMEILGHFLLSQVGNQRSAFFIKWLNEPQDDSLTSGAYFVEKSGNEVLIDHLENDRVVAFQTSRSNLIDIIKHWEGVCKNEAYSACKVGGYEVSICRETNGHSEIFAFNTHDYN